jgi:FKBP-type peptidyl-prolyl cis-trans isomerase (trigger factor)
VVQRETKSAIYDIVRANTERGISKEALDERSEEIYSVASNSAKERVKARIVLSRIAEQENLHASQEEIRQRVAQLAAQHQIKPDRLYKQLEERGALEDVAEEIVSAKVLDLLELHARPIEVPLST